jgi:hypothetical protein
MTKLRNKSKRTVTSSLPSDKYWEQINHVIEEPGNEIPITHTRCDCCSKMYEAKNVTDESVLVAEDSPEESISQTKEGIDDVVTNLTVDSETFIEDVPIETIVYEPLDNHLIEFLMLPDIALNIFQYIPGDSIVFVARTTRKWFWLVRVQSKDFTPEVDKFWIRMIKRDLSRRFTDEQLQKVSNRITVNSYGLERSAILRSRKKRSKPQKRVIYKDTKIQIPTGNGGVPKKSLKSRWEEFYLFHVTRTIQARSMKFMKFETKCLHDESTHCMYDLNKFDIWYDTNNKLQIKCLECGIGGFCEVEKDRSWYDPLVHKIIKTSEALY